MEIRDKISALHRQSVFPRTEASPDYKDRVPCSEIGFYHQKLLYNWQAAVGFEPTKSG